MYQSGAFSDHSKWLSCGDLAETALDILRLCFELSEGCKEIRSPHYGEITSIPWRLVCDLQVLTSHMKILETKHLALARVASHVISGLSSSRTGLSRCRHSLKTTLEAAVGEETYHEWFKIQKNRVFSAAAKATETSVESDLTDACLILCKFVRGYTQNVLESVVRSLALLWVLWFTPTSVMSSLHEDKFANSLSLEKYPLSELSKSWVWGQPHVLSYRGVLFDLITSQVTSQQHYWRQCWPTKLRPFFESELERANLSLLRCAWLSPHILSQFHSYTDSIPARECAVCLASPRDILLSKISKTIRFLDETKELMEKVNELYSKAENEFLQHLSWVPISNPLCGELSPPLLQTTIRARWESVRVHLNYVNKFRNILQSIFDFESFRCRIVSDENSTKGDILEKAHLSITRSFSELFDKMKDKWNHLFPHIESVFNAQKSVQRAQKQFQLLDQNRPPSPPHFEQPSAMLSQVASELLRSRLLLHSRLEKPFNLIFSIVRLLEKTPLGNDICNLIFQTQKLFFDFICKPITSLFCLLGNEIEPILSAFDFLLKVTSECVENVSVAIPPLKLRLSLIFEYASEILNGNHNPLIDTTQMKPIDCSEIEFETLSFSFADQNEKKNQNSFPFPLILDADVSTTLPHLPARPLTPPPLLTHHKMFLNQKAIAALGKVEQKMSCVGVDGNLGSIEERVDETIRAALSPQNLSELYEGWLAWI
jgi:hypothetical protein